MFWFTQVVFGSKGFKNLLEQNQAGQLLTVMVISLRYETFSDSQPETPHSPKSHLDEISHTMNPHSQSHTTTPLVHVLML